MILGSKQRHGPKQLESQFNPPMMSRNTENESFEKCRGSISLSLFLHPKSKWEKENWISQYFAKSRRYYVIKHRRMYL